MRIRARVGWLIGFRAVQGLGAAMLMPQTLAIVTMTFPPERRGAAFGIWGAVAGLATIAGPTLGGLLVTAFDWRWIFFVNLPIGAAVLAVTFVIIPRLRPGRRHRLDILGVALASLALLAICYGLVEGQRYDWGRINSFVSIPLVIGAGMVLLAVFLLVQKLRQDREPLIPFALFLSRNFTLMNWVSFTLSIGMLGIFLPFTIYLQSALGFSALKAGLAMAPSSLVMIAVAPFLGKLTDKTGGKYILICGLTLFAVGMGWAVLIATPHSAWYDFLPALIVAGLGMGGTFAPLTTVAMREVDPRMAGAASGMLNTTRQVGSVIGTAAVGALLQNRLVASLTSQACYPVGRAARRRSGSRSSAGSGSPRPAACSPAALRVPPQRARRRSRRRSRRSCAGSPPRSSPTVTCSRCGGPCSCRSPSWSWPRPAALPSRTSLRQDRIAAPGADSGQMAGTISSPGSLGSSGHSPGSSSGTAS